MILTFYLKKYKEIYKRKGKISRFLAYEKWGQASEFIDNKMVRWKYLIQNVSFPIHALKNLTILVLFIKFKDFSIKLCSNKNVIQ